MEAMEASGEPEVRHLLPEQPRASDMQGTPPAQPLAEDRQGLKPENTRYRAPVAPRPCHSIFLRYRSLTLMVLLYLLGVATAVAQHLFYSHANGREIDHFTLSQSSVTKISTAMAFLLKTSLVGAMCVVYSQRSWFSFRRTAISIRGIDAIFGILQSPFKFFVPEMLVRTPTLTLLALITWFLPISAILSPSALTVVDSPFVSNVPTLVPVIGSLNGSAGLYEIENAAPIQFGGVTPQLQRLAMRVFTGGEIVPWPSPCGVNCSYDVSFEGPAYNCFDIYDPKLLVGDFRVLYTATEALVDPPNGYNYTNLTGSYQVTDGVWLNRTLANATYLATHCELHAATYNCHVNYTNNVPAITTTVVRGEQIYGSSFSDMVLEYSGQIPRNNRTETLVNYWAIEQAVEGLLSGYLAINRDVSSGINGSTSNLQLWALVGFNESYTELAFPTDFARNVEELMVNTTLSMAYFVRNPIFVPQGLGFNGFANNTPAAISTTVNATMLTFPAVYAYSPRTLWTVYGVSLGVVFVCMIFGGMMFFENGINADLSFSQVLVTTRNESLDALSYGSCLGGWTISDELKGSRIKFGELILRDGEIGDWVGHACFGLEKEIGALRRDGVYQGIELKVT